MNLKMEENFPPKCWDILARQHSVIFRNTMVYIVTTMEHFAKLNYPYTKFDQNLYNSSGNDAFKQTGPLLYVFIKYYVMKAHTYTTLSFFLTYSKHYFRGEALVKIFYAFMLN